jgi:hypothetical protein
MEENTQPLLKGFTRLAGTPEQIASELGPLADLAGTWKGASGWNLIAVPSQKSGQPTFTLLIHQYSETITFTPITAPVPNRGGTTQQFITGLMYDLTVTNLNDNHGVLHIENGMWLNMADIETQPDGPVVESVAAPQPFMIARQSAIPHGDVVIALGNATTSVLPDIPPVSALPNPVGLPPVFGYGDQYTTNKFQDIFKATNVNATLAATAAAQTITHTTTITVDTQNGGNISNIPFIDKFVNPSRFQSTFWIEDVVANGITFKQLQYSQQADLNFIKKFNMAGDIMWPHVNVNTLVKI